MKNNYFSFLLTDIGVLYSYNTTVIVYYAGCWLFARYYDKTLCPNTFKKKKTL